MPTSTYVSPLDYPGLSNVHLPGDLLRAIGHVTALWAQLERIIDSTIRHALDFPEFSGIDTALILPFRKRLALLDDLMTRALPTEDEHRRSMARKVIAELTGLQPFRDLIVHGAIGGSQTIRDGTTVYTFQRIRWDRPVRVLQQRALSIAEIEQIAAAISDTRRRRLSSRSRFG